MPRRQIQRYQRRETIIEDAIIAHPGRLGFPDALAIRNCRVAPQAGLVDVMLLPLGGRVKLVLVEAKVAIAADAASKVIGQLLMYYAGALMLGTRGLRLMRQFAIDHRDDALSTKWISPKALSGGLSPPKSAWGVLNSGRALQPSEVRLFVAIDGKSHQALVPTLTILRAHHRLEIGLVEVQNGECELVWPPVATR